jgi:prepilin-type N-terminal cleavage/methylation domain-containing protein
MFFKKKRILIRFVFVGYALAPYALTLCPCRHLHLWLNAPRIIETPHKAHFSLFMRKAFTLIELLVVIAILAVLAVVVVLTLNPNGLLAEARDSNRLSDMATIKSAITIFQADGGTSIGSAGGISVSIPDPTATTTAGTNCATLGLASSTSMVPYHCGESASSTYRLTTGVGWIPINFSSDSAGQPFSELPIDPTNSISSNLYYTYLTDGAGNWKMFAQMESSKYMTPELCTRTADRVRPETQRTIW